MKDDVVILNELKTKQPNLFEYLKYRKFIMDSSCAYNECKDCPLDKWCDYHMRFQEPLNRINYLWYDVIAQPFGNWFSKTILKNKIYTCSVCGLMEKPLDGSICGEYGWRKEKGKYICHHCAYHQNDDYIMSNSKQCEILNISHEAYQRHWREFVEEHNALWENNK